MRVAMLKFLKTFAEVRLLTTSSSRGLTVTPSRVITVGQIMNMLLLIFDFEEVPVWVKKR